MNIVVIGAGEIGSYISLLLSQEQHNVVLIDKSIDQLKQVTDSLDVATRLGNATDWQLLDDLLEMAPDFLIALTDDDEANLVACAIAKNLGYPHTIARVKDNRFLNRTRLDFANIFDVDYFIGPELLVANEILKHIISPSSLMVESFVHGSVQMRTLSVPENWRKGDRPLKTLNLPSGMILSLIRRITATGDEVIFPHGNDHIQPGDEVTLIGETLAIAQAHEFFGIAQEPIKYVVIVGGSLTGSNLARLLNENDISVRLIEKSYERCCLLSDQLPHITIVNHDGTDLEFLIGEKVDQADMFVACTLHDEVNILAAMLAKEAGCKHALVVLNNNSYAPLVARLGINHVVSPRVVTANHILSQLFSGTVTSLISLYDNRAEVMEINVSLDSTVAGIPLSELGPLLPVDFLIAMIQNRGRIMVAHGNRVISPGDTVIVMTSPDHIPELEKLF